MRNTHNMFLTLNQINKKMRSKFFALNWRDFLKGLIVAVLTAVFAVVAGLIQTGELFSKESLPVIGVAALTALLAYLSKNLFTNSSGEILTGEK